MNGVLSSSGSLKLKAIRKPSLISKVLPSFKLPREVFWWRVRNLPNLIKGSWKTIVAKLCNIPHFYGEVELTRINADGSQTYFGLASLRVVTDTGVGFIVDAFQNLVELEIMNYHGIGTGTNAEAVGDTALQTELTTQYNPDNTRATGTQSEPAANQYRSTGVNTVDAAVAITEHGLLSQSAVGGGVLLDRSKFSAINLASGDSLSSQYTITFTSGS